MFTNPRSVIQRDQLRRLVRADMEDEQQARDAEIREVRTVQLRERI